MIQFASRLEFWIVSSVAYLLVSFSDTQGEREKLKWQYLIMFIAAIFIF